MTDAESKLSDRIMAIAGEIEAMPTEDVTVMQLAAAVILAATATGMVMRSPRSLCSHVAEIVRRQIDVIDANN